MPTEISYSGLELHKWGYEIKPSEKKIIYLPLLLNPLNPLNDVDSLHPLTQSKGSIPDSKTPVEVVEDYLSSLRKHVLATLKRVYGSPFMGMCGIDYALVVPEVESHL